MLKNMELEINELFGFDGSDEDDRSTEGRIKRIVISAIDNRVNLPMDGDKHKHKQYN